MHKNECKIQKQTHWVWCKNHIPKVLPWALCLQSFREYLLSKLIMHTYLKAFYSYITVPKTDEIAYNFRFRYRITK